MFWRKHKEQPSEDSAPAMAETAETVTPSQAAPDPAMHAGAGSADDEGDVATMDAPEDTGPSPEIARAQLEGRIIEAISTVYDPEIPVNIYEMGLIYDLNITADGCVRVQMTLTSPACPVAGSLPGEVEAKIREVEGVNDVALELVWDPPWTPDRMSEAAKLELGFM